MTTRPFTRGLPLLVLAAALWSPSPAEARRFSGERVTHLADLSEEAKKGIKPDTGVEPAIGFHYSYGGIFWLDFWTWDGEYCLFAKDGDRWVYNSLRPNEAAELAGLEEGELGKPFFYTYPLGLLLVGAIVAVWIGVTLVKRRKDKQFARHLENMMDDPRYQRAMEIIREDIEREPVAGDDVPGDEAIDGFQMLLTVMSAYGDE